MNQLLWVCVGGGLGSGGRYLVGVALPRWPGTGLPWATLLVNVLGSFLLAFLVQSGARTGWMTPTLRLALTTGVMGGFTTYSTFNLESLKLLQTGAWGQAGAYMAATMILCLGAGFAGLSLGASGH